MLSEFSAMPYSHYKALASQSAAMVTNVNDTIHDINYGQTSYTPQLTVLDETGTAVFNNGIGSINSFYSNNFIPFAIPLGGWSFPVTVNADSADSMSKLRLAPPARRRMCSMTLRIFRQHFYNYYSYDDGSAEVAYGVTGNTDVKLAYRFDLKSQDTLRGIQIYFNQVGTIVHTKLFQLAGWDQLNVGTNSDNLVHK